MAIEHTVDLEWVSGFLDGEGTITRSTSGKLTGTEVSWPDRVDDETERTSPEELLAAAHASCYAMQLASSLIGGGWEPTVMNISCTVGFEVGIGITSSNLTARVEVDGEIPDEKLREAAERAKILCPVSKALAGIEVTLDLPDLAPVVDEDEEAAVDAEAAVDDEAGVETED